MNTESKQSASSKQKLSLFWRLLTLAAATVGGGFLLIVFWIALLPAPFVLGGNEKNIDRQIAANGRFLIEFSARMDRTSVEKAISTEPSLETEFEWQNDHAVAIVPQSALTEGETIVVRISEHANDWLGKSIAAPVVFSYLVTTAPQVSMVSPISANDWHNAQNRDAEDTDRLLPESVLWKKGEPITVMLDRPIRTLRNENQEDSEELFGRFLSFDPPIKGKFSALGTTAFEFVADEESWPQSQEVTATLKAGLPSIDGGSTTETITWTLRTPPPLLTEVMVGDRILDYNDETKTFSGQYILPSASIRMDWNMPLDIESLFAKMTISPERTVKNDIIKRGDQKNDLVFMDFDPPLARGETIEVVIDRGVDPLSGGSASVDPFRILFETLPEPCVRIAREGAPRGISIDPNGGVELEFCTLTSRWDETEQEEYSMQAALREHLVLTPSIEEDDLDISCNGTICTLWFPSEPRDRFEISFEPGLEDIFGQAVPTDGFTAVVTVDDYPPLLTSLTRSGLRSTYDAAEPVGVYFTTRNVQSLEFVSCSVPTETVRRIEAEGGWGWNEFSCARSGNNTRSRTIAIPGETNATSIFEVPLFPDERLPEVGTVYFWQASSPQVRDPWNNEIRRFSGAVYPINAGLTLQHGEDFVTVWANDFANGEPVEGMDISLIDQGGNVAGNGKTDERGLLTLQRPDAEAAFFVEGRTETSAAFVGSTWEDGIATWDFGLDFDWRSSPSLTGTIITDRPIYRPGDTVNFKGILRNDIDASFEIPLQKEIFITVENSRGEEILATEQTLDEYGTIAGTLALAAESSTGMYQVFVSTSAEREWNKTVSSVFWVEEYKKPEYKVSFAGNEEFVSGETFATTITSEYFFGTPLKNATVEWHVIASPLYFDRWSGGGWFSFGTDDNWCFWYCPDTQQTVERGTGTTDEDGKFAISFPIETDAHVFYTLTATVVDANGRTVSATRTTPVFSGEFVLGVRTTDFWLDENNNSLTAEVLATDTDGNGLPGKRITATLQQVTWNNIKKQDVDGNFYWENTQEFSDIATMSVTTNIGGKTEITFPLTKDKSNFGALRVLVEAEDEKGNRISAADQTWRSSDVFMTQAIRNNNDRIDITVETPEVAPGETIRILPESPFAGDVWAYISVGRKQLVFRDVFLWRAGTPIEITATEAMMPNTFVFVTLFQGRGDLYAIRDDLAEFHEQKQALTQAEERVVALRNKLGNITDSLLDENSAEIMDALRKGMETTEQDLAFAAQEVLSLTDQLADLEASIRETIGAEAEIPAVSNAEPYPEIKFGITPVKVSAESKRLAVKIAPTKSEYLPGEEAEVVYNITDSFGNPIENADLSIAVVDESLLALKSRQDEDIFAVFFHLRDLGIRLASSLVYFIDRLDVDTLGGQKGGGGGSDLELLQKKRGEFRDTAFWLANIRTDINGEARSKFRLPDNVTSWQIWVTANTEDSRFGSAKMNFFSRKPLLVVPLAPRFLIAGDTATIGATIVNRHSDELIITADFSAQNAEILRKDAGVFRIAGNEETTLYYTVKASANDESPLAEFAPAIFTFSIKGDTATAVDTLEITVPIEAPAIGESIATNGFLDQAQTSVTEKVGIPGGILPDIGQIFVTVSAGAIGDLGSGLAALARFPYGCTEQIISSHLPNLAILQLISAQKELFEADAFDEASIREMITTGVQSIYAMQNPDGGFGFWQGSDRSYPFLTAYALFGLEQSLASGISIDKDIREKARAYLRQKVWEDLRTVQVPADEPSFPDADARAFAMYVLSYGDDFDESMLSRLYERRAQMSAEGKAFVMLTAQRVLNARPSPITMTLLRELEQAAVQSDRTANFEPSGYSWNFGSDIRTTAIAMLAIMNEDPAHPLLPKFLQYLRDTKRSAAGYTASPWGTTQNTAWVLFALIAFMDKNPYAAAGVEIFFNGISTLSDRVGDQNRSKTAELPMADANTGITANTIDINKSGGAVSYDIVANYFLPVDRITPQNHGFGIFRELFAFSDSGTSQTPITALTQGDLAHVRTTILVPESRHFVGVRIPIPAGTEAVNFALETEDESLQNRIDPCRQSWCPENENWRFTHREYRDDHVFLFADYLPSGRYQFDFLLRANVAGEYRLLPALVEELYHPETFGRSEGGIFEISRREAVRAEESETEETPSA